MSIFEFFKLFVSVIKRQYCKIAKNGMVENSLSTIFPHAKPAIHYFDEIISLKKYLRFTNNVIKGMIKNDKTTLYISSKEYPT
jgi:hypothetical protein